MPMPACRLQGRTTTGVETSAIFIESFCAIIVGHGIQAQASHACRRVRFATRWPAGPGVPCGALIDQVEIRNFPGRPWASGTPTIESESFQPPARTRSRPTLKPNETLPFSHNIANDSSAAVDL